MSPSDLFGGSFPILYAGLILVAFVAGLVIPRRLRPTGRRHRVADVDQLAYLAGGAARFRDAVVAGLLARKMLFLGGTRRRPVFGLGAHDRAISPAERSVLALHQPVRWQDISQALQHHVERLRQRMIVAGLLVTDAQRASLRFWALLPWLMLLTFGAVLGLSGAVGGQPFLIALLVVTLIFAALRAVTIDERTRAGVEALQQALPGTDRLRRAPTGEETALAVALFGTAVLAATPWSDLHRYRSDGGGGCSAGGFGCGGGGSGGCGGGGCGGS